MKTEQTDAGQAVRSTPLFGHVVICNRKWRPQHVGNDGPYSRETLLAKRMSNEPWTTDVDTSKYCWWEGVNEAEGCYWSDSTVESWRPIELPNNNLKVGS